MSFLQMPLSENRINILDHNEKTEILDSDEKIIWQGKPYPGLVFSGRDIPSVLSRWLFLGFAILLTSGTLTQWLFGGSKISFEWPGILFVALVFHFAVTQYFWDAFVRRQTWYTLTSKRAIIATKVLGKRTLKRYPILKETTVEFDETAGGSVWFATTTYNDSDCYKITTHIGFVGVERPREVFSLMRKVQTDT